MRLIARIFVFISMLFIILYGILPGFFRVEGSLVPSYVAGKNFLHGIDPAIFYRFPDFQKLIDASGLSHGIFSLTVSTPAAFILDALIAIPPVVVSRFLITALDLTALVLLVHATAKLANSSVITAYLVFLSSSFALATNFSSSEPFIILTLVFAAAFFAFSIKAERAAGVVLGVAFLFEPFFAIPAILFLLSKRWRVFVYFILSSVFVLAVTYMVVGESAVVYYLQRVFPFYINGRVGNPFSTSYQTGWSFFRRLFYYNPTLNPNPMLASRNLYVLSISLLKAFAVVPATYYFYRGIERNNPRDAFVASTFPIIFLSPTGTIFQLVLLAPAIICLSQAALEEQRTGTAKAFIVLYAMACIPFFTGIADYFTISSPIFLYEELFVLLSIYILYLIFQLRTLPGHLLVWRMSLAAAMIAAVTTTLYFGDTTPRTPTHFRGMPALNGQQLRTAAFSPVSFGDNLAFVGVDSNSQNYTVQFNDPDSGAEVRGREALGNGGAAAIHESRNCYRVSSSDDGIEVMIQTVSEGEPYVNFRNDEGTVSYLGETGSVSPGGNFGAFIRVGNLYIVNMLLPRSGSSTKRFRIVDSLVVRPFKILQCSFNSDENSEIDFVTDSLNGEYSIGLYDLQTRSLITYHTQFPISLIAADKGKIYTAFDDNDSTSVWSQSRNPNPQVGPDPPVELFAVHGSIIDINLLNHGLYFSSDFQRGLGLPTIYKVNQKK